MIYYFIMVAVYPFYAPGGYVRIGEVKYVFFRNATLLVLAVAGGIVLLSALAGRDRGWIVGQYRRMSVTDWLVYSYCLAVMMSYMCSSYKESALWGAEGWYMGVMSQIMFGLIYFFFSRFFRRYTAPGRTERRTGERSLGIWLLAASGVFLLGICNRYSLYPVVLEGQTETFISTLGNINWFCGYWSVAAPPGIVLYWCSERSAARVLLAVYSLIAMLAGITQGSNSAYLVFLVLLAVLFILSMQSNQKLYRFLELCMLFMAACLTGRLMQYLPGLSYNYWGTQADTGSGITAMLLTGGSVAWICAFLFLPGIYVLARVLERRGRFAVGRHKWLWGMMAAAVMAAVCIVVLLLMIDNEVIYFREVPGTVEYDGYLEAVLDEDWGNGRGATWKCGMDAYRSMDRLHKAFGIGPDCFADYIYDIPELAARMIERFGNLRLTNAHNEWITILVDTGILGLFCYIGIFLTAFVRYLYKGTEKPLLIVVAVTLLTYTVHNMVSFQQILNTPYIFMVLGMGEAEARAGLHRPGDGGAVEKNPETAGSL